MAFFVLVGIVLILATIGFFGGMFSKNENPQGDGGLVASGSIIVAVVLIFLITLFRTFHTVDNGHIGIVKQFGPVVGTTDSGLVTIAPWQTIDDVSVKNELRTYDMDTANSAVSADSQSIFMIVQVNYSLERGRAVELYRKTGGDFVNRILDPAVYQLTKEVTAEYKAIDVAQNREAIRQKIEERISDEVEKQGIRINTVSLKNVRFTGALTNAIEQTVEAQQQAKREDARVQIAKAQAQQKIAQAEGDRKAQELQQRSLTPLLVQKYAIDKLNPNVQVIICPARSICVPNAGAIGAATAGH